MLCHDNSFGQAISSLLNGAQSTRTLFACLILLRDQALNVWLLVSRLQQQSYTRGGARTKIGIGLRFQLISISQEWSCRIFLDWSQMERDPLFGTLLKGVRLLSRKAFFGYVMRGRVCYSGRTLGMATPHLQPLCRVISAIGWTKVAHFKTIKRCRLMEGSTGLAPGRLIRESG